MVIVISLNLVVNLARQQWWTMFIVMVFFFNAHLLPLKRWQLWTPTHGRHHFFELSYYSRRTKMMNHTRRHCFSFQCSFPISREMMTMNTTRGHRHFLKVMVYYTKEMMTMKYVHRCHLFFMLTITSTKETTMMTPNSSLSPFFNY
jgi:hypothetical protein